jgi:hypothetical protein
MRALQTDTPRRSFEAAKTFERPLPGHALFLQLKYFLEQANPAELHRGPARQTPPMTSVISLAKCSPLHAK